MNVSRPRIAAALLAGVLLLAVSGCSKAGQPADQQIKKPDNVSSKPEQLLPAPMSAVDDTKDWTELPSPIGGVFAASLDKGKFQAFAAMKQVTVSVRLKSAPKEQDLFRAMNVAAAFIPEDYSLLLNVYAPGSDGKDRYAGYEWTPLSGVLVKKASADADQGWDAAITSITQGSVTEIEPPAMKRLAAGEVPLPIFK